MLFVGFSLSDEDFHRIAHDVRRALGSSADASPFATALLLNDERLLEELWSGDVDCVPVTTNASDPVAGRQLEIFLDYLLSCSTSNAEHLLDPAYGGVLTPEEAALRDHLQRFVEETPPRAQEASAWGAVERLLASLGRRRGV